MSRGTRVVTEASARHRAEVRPRYGRIAVLGTSVAVLAVSLLGAGGVLPSTLTEPSSSAADPTGDAAHSPAAQNPAQNPGAQNPAAQHPVPQVAAAPGAAAVRAAVDLSADPTLPAASGTGRRVVYSESRQRVWLVADGDRVVRTYRVSGTVYDNLEPGTYAVYSRSQDAVGIDDSGTMKYFVRFTRGPSGAAIGFHDIPIDGGRPVQSVAQLGTPRSHGCIRQRRVDARALWEFAPLGTTVVVTT